jgi:hypothetical protein
MSATSRISITMGVVCFMKTKVGVMEWGATTAHRVWSQWASMGPRYPRHVLDFHSEQQLQQQPMKHRTQSAVLPMGRKSRFRDMFLCLGDVPSSTGWNIRSHINSRVVCCGLQCRHSYSRYLCREGAFWCSIRLLLWEHFDAQFGCCCCILFVAATLPRRTNGQ